MGAKLTGADKMRRNLEKIADRGRQVSGVHEYRLDELYKPDFMRRFTNYGTIDEMFKASGFKMESADDLKRIPEAEWDAFVQRSTHFTNWREMQRKAMSERTGRQLGFRK
jgi:hypothetical protein